MFISIICFTIILKSCVSNAGGIKMKWTIYMFLALSLIMVGSVMAADSISEILGESTKDYENESMDVRYDVLVCNIDYVVGQIDSIEDYANDLDANIIEDLIDNKEELDDDKDILNTLYDDDNSSNNNLTAFNEFINGTLKPDYDNAIDLLNEFDNDYEDYIDSNDRDEFHDELLELQDDHADCIIEALENDNSTDDDNETSDDDDETSDDDDELDYYGKSLDLRYENLLCKIDFTVGQIDVINNYTNDPDADIIEELLDDKEELLDDKDDLKDVYDDKNVTEFNDFVKEVLHPDFNKTMYDLKEFKDDYKEYVDEEDREDFRNELSALKDEYNECTSTRYRDMSKLMDKYYKHKAKMWDQIIKSMQQRELTTEEMEEVREKLLERLDDLEDAINSGDQARIAEQLRLMSQEHLQLWAKFHSGRLNSYLNRIEPAANQYGRSEQMNKIRAQLHKFDNLSEEDKEDAKKVWSELRDSADDMREMGKGMLKQKMEDKGKGRNR